MSHRERSSTGQFAKGNKGRPKGSKNRPKASALAAQAIYEQLIGSIKTGRLYVYGHYAAGQCFYIGKGRDRRAWDCTLGSRNPSWHEYVDRLRDMGMDYDVRIITGNLSEDEALAIEAALIRVRQPVCNIVHSAADPSQLSIAV